MTLGENRKRERREKGVAYVFREENKEESTYQG